MGAGELEGRDKLGHGEENICTRFWGRKKFAGCDIENKGIVMDCAYGSCGLHLIIGEKN